MQNGDLNRGVVAHSRSSMVLVSCGRKTRVNQPLSQGALLQLNLDEEYQLQVTEFGTGFVINTAGQVVTCAHVIDRALNNNHENGGTLIWQVTESGAFTPHTVQLESIIFSKNHDIAVLTPQEGETLTPLAGKPAHCRSGGQPVHYWGWFYSPERMSLIMVLRGGILCPNVLPASAEMSSRLLFEGVAAAGSSGSALVSSQGELVGMVSAVHMRPKESADLGEAVPVSAIYDVLTYAGVKLAWEE